MKSIQYTIRNVPEPVDQVIRKRAKRANKSFNQTVVELLTLQAFGDTKPRADNFDWLNGAGKDLLGPEFDEAIKDQSRIDEELWR